MKDYSEHTWHEFANEMVVEKVFTQKIVDLFIKNISDYRDPSDTIGWYPSSPIKSAFTWAGASKGYYFWEKLNNKFLKLEP